MPAILWENHSVQVMRLVAKFYKNVEFTDCVLDVEGGTIHCHKTILAACSLYLKKLFDDHNGRQIIPIKEVKYNDMYRILDYIYFGEVDVPVTDMASFKETAELLQISSLRCASLKFSEESFMEDVSGMANRSMDLLKHKESNLCVKENTVIFCNQVLAHVEEEEEEEKEGLNSSCWDIDLQLIGDSKTKAINALKEVSEKESKDKLKVSILNGSGVEMDIMSEGPENLQDDLIPITFVAVSPVSVNSEGLENEQSVCDSQLKNPLEQCPYICDVMKTKEEKSYKSEAERNLEMKEELDVSELGFETTENVSLSEAMQNSSGSGTVYFTHEKKHSCDELTTVEDNCLMATEHVGGIHNNQSGTYDGSASSVYSGEYVVDGTEDLEAKFESVCDIPDSDLKEGKLFGNSRGLKKKKKKTTCGFVWDQMKPKSQVDGGNNNSASNKSCESSTKRSTQNEEKDLKKSSKDLHSFNSSQSDGAFSSTITYDHHLPSHSGRSCHLSEFTSTEELAELVQTPCDFGVGSLAHEASLTEHILKGTGKKRFQCKTCTASFSQGFLLKRHMLSHTSEKPFLCDICGKAFRTKTTLIFHTRIHTGEKPYSCEICKASFRQSGILDRHLRIHTGEKPFECDICGRTFISKPSLVYHIRTHTGEKPYSCSVCQASFKQSGYLTVHMRTHTGEKPYSCSLCQVSFYQSGQLKDHLRKHTGKKPFSCSLCGKSYWRRNNLKEHMNKHTGVKPFLCKICQASFCRRTTLTAHTLTHTNGKNYRLESCF